MSIDSVTGYQPPALAPTTSPDRVVNNDTNNDEKSPAESASSTQFATLLALLAGNGHRVRANLMQKAAPGDVALLDRLLNGTLVSDDVSASATKNAATDATGTSATAGAAADAVRYGMLKELASMVLADTRTTLNNASADSSINSRTAIGSHTGKTDDATIAGLARALESSKGNSSLSRATKRNSSLEELMALGDTQGAKTRAILDALLNSAGTPAGAVVADSGASLAAAGTSAAELVAFVSALTAARNASAADPGTAVVDTNALMPELRSKLDRVMARMQNEVGHDVQVVETARSPERQAQLYAQGRTTPGQVVTWTLDSAHLRGAAVDVVVDGSWNNPEGFAQLQRIAREEGLRTLGAKDPGHLELMNAGDDTDLLTNSTVRNASTTATSSNTAGASGVARVANVAGVAQVAVAGTSARNTIGDRTVTAQDRNVANIGLGSLAESASRGAAGDSLGDAKREEQRNNSRDGVRERSRDSKSPAARDGAFPAYGSTQNAPNTNGYSNNATERVAPAAGTSSAQRVADVNALREDAPAKAVSQMTLDVEGPDGGSQRITVDMRGNAVTTHIATDTTSADRMRARVGELQGALEQHGLQSEAVRITTPGNRVADAADQVKQAASQGERDALRLAGANGSTAGDGASQQGLRDRPGAARDWEKHNDARNARDEQRQGSGQRNRRGPNYEEQ